MANSYDVNDVVRVTGTFTSTAGTAANPGKVTFVLEDPSGLITTHTSTGASVTNPAIGTFYTDVVIDQEGVYEYRVYSTGTIRSATQGWWRVRTRRAV